MTDGICFLVCTFSVVGVFVLVFFFSLWIINNKQQIKWFDVCTFHCFMIVYVVFAVDV